MSLEAADIDFAADLFSGLGGVTTRRMFGGICLYREGTVFALMSSDGRLYLKTKDPEALFGAPAERFHSMPYFALPEAALEEPDTACDLARKALAAL